MKTLMKVHDSHKRVEASSDGHNKEVTASEKADQEGDRQREAKTV